MDVFLTWLVEGGIGPAGVGVPVTWAASGLAGKSRRWFQWVRRADDLSRIVRAATDGNVDLTRAEFDAVRDLLGQESTWASLGRDSVKDLAARIAECLGKGDEAKSQRAGGAIARGLLEFVAGDLEPEWFQKIVFARFARLEALQDFEASALDKAMSGLATLAACRETDGKRIRQITEQLGLVLDRLQPRRAGCQEVMAYLGVLIQSLNSGSWPADSRFPRPVVGPAAIERKLRVGNGEDRGPCLDADELGRESSRLVVLGGPGSGKTWLAKRTARLCAERALDSLAGGADPGEVELPLYTTCARLAAMRPDDGIHRAVVASAFASLPALGSVRAEEALRELFEERNTSTLLVIDSLDEARDPYGRVRQAGSLPTTWRVMLTSRPGSWEQQLAVPEKDEVVLQPLRYPEDIEPFVQAWFRGRPDRAAALMAELGDRLDLQEMVTVPLLLTFCCTISGDQPLPGRRTGLYEKVIKRMLTGWWRGAGRDPEYRTGECLDTLCGWAWDASSSHPISGAGDWQDEFSTLPVETERNREALAHVAVPVSQQDIDTERTRRRFVHRSVHEYLTARYVSRMPVLEAAAVLLRHVWYDPDWEYAAPAALAMHPDREQVLRELVGQVTGGDGTAAGVAAVDGCWEFRRFLARVAEESSQADWPSEAAELIGQARMDLLISKRGLPDLTSADWPATNRLIRERLLPANRRIQDVEYGHHLLPKLIAGAEERAVARQELLRNLASADDGWRAARLASTIAKLDPSAGERAIARQELLRFRVLADDNGGAEVLEEAIAELSSTAEERALARQELLRNLAGTIDGQEAVVLWEMIAKQDPTPKERTAARQKLLRLMADDDNEGVSVLLGKVVTELDPTTEERAVTRRQLLRIPTGLNRYWEAMGWGKSEVLAEMIAELDPTAEERATARRELMRLLTDGNKWWKAEGTANAIAKLEPTAEERATARQELLRNLADGHIGVPPVLPGEAIARLTVRPDERDATRRELLRILTSTNNTEVAAAAGDAVAKLEPTAMERAVARQELLRNLVRTAHAPSATRLRQTIVTLAVRPDERDATRLKLLRAMTRVNDSWWMAGLLWETSTELEPTAEERAVARQELLRKLGDPRRYWGDKFLVNLIRALAVGAEERDATRRELLRILRDPGKCPLAAYLGKAIAELDPAAEERAMARQELLRQARTTDDWPSDLAEVIAELDATAEELSEIRQPLLRLARSTHEVDVATNLCVTISKLGVTVADIGDSRTWTVPPTPRLMTAARRNSALRVWLAALPLLSDYPRRPEPDSALTTVGNE